MRTLCRRIQSKIQANQLGARHRSSGRCAAPQPSDARSAFQCSKIFRRRKKVEVSISLNQTSARVSVTDYGIGINDDFRGKIFEKFSQAENPNIRSASGTGLGLSISRSIIEKHQGTIDFKSELKSGSTFYFEIPLDLNH